MPVSTVQASHVTPKHLPNLAFHLLTPPLIWASIYLVAARHYPWPAASWFQSPLGQSSLNFVYTGPADTIFPLSIANIFYFITAYIHQLTTLSSRALLFYFLYLNQVSLFLEPGRSNAERMEKKGSLFSCSADSALLTLSSSGPKALMTEHKSKLCLS